MEILYQIGFIIILSIVSGIFGRLGGRDKDGLWYDFISKTWIRDWLCPLIALIALWLLVGFKLSYWWAYLIAYGLMGVSLSTYYDWMFKKDNLWVSGCIVGLSIIPLRLDVVLVITRAIMLAVIWGCLNKYLPSAGIAGDKRILLWRRDIVEEFIRYFSVVFSLIIL